MTEPTHTDRRADFPIFSQQVHGHPLVYLDSAASAQMPQCVIDRLQQYHQCDHANVHRGVHQLSQRASLAYDDARERVAQFIGAGFQDLVFTRGTTESLNLVASAYLSSRLQAGDEILLTQMEHHSNIVPWQQLCQKVGATVRVIPLCDDGRLDLKAAKTLLQGPVKLLSVTHVSNVLGVINPLKTLIEMAHAQGVPVCVDGAQAVGHQVVDVAALGCDFYAFSAHKMYGPTGMGALYIHPDRWAQMDVYQTGGGMIRTVDFNHVTFTSGPMRFEAGTPHIAGAVAWAQACDYIDAIGLDALMAHEKELTDYALERLCNYPGLKIYGPVESENRSGVFSFSIDGIHPHDLGTIVDTHGVAIRVGHHCAMPLMKHYQINAMARASLGCYNQASDIDALIGALEASKAIFSRGF